SIIQRARDKGVVSIYVHDIHDYGKGKYKQIDDYQYGGGAGMVLMVEPLDRLISDLKAERTYDEVIFMTPDAPVMTQATINQLSLAQNIIILAGHYKGVDKRLRDLHITREISIGDFVLSGGELPAAVLTDAIVRLLPGAMSDETSALTDSFQNNLLAPPVYTRPPVYKNMKVPDVLLSGNHQKIADWREQQAEMLTQKIRPDLLNK
ncbi:MAG TPA: tRNA (guanosine(37)-N1)-methyltransferase TrmD, partial [Flavobacteriales bacterium]|nr:tRNA (guanosine(37)-N1)-methyltransferase TrmD [Flavobacteriales bacterium]